MKRTAKRIFTLILAILAILAAAFLAFVVPYCRRAAALDSCPDSLLPSMAYMLVNNRATWIRGAWSFFAAALITVSMNTAAYLAEALRGGMESLDRSPVEAAQMDGASHWQTMTRIIFPQALQNALPAIGNELVNNIKGTSVLNIIGFVELMFATGTVAGFYYRYLSAYLIAAVIYLAMTVTITRAVEWTMRKAGISEKK